MPSPTTYAVLIGDDGNPFAPKRKIPERKVRIFGLPGSDGQVVSPGDCEVITINEGELSVISL